MTENLTLSLLEAAQEFQGPSKSHDAHHTRAVLRYADWLTGLHGGDPEIIKAAAILHDLGRSNPLLHGARSRELSARLAELVMNQVSFPFKKIPQVVSCILEHDQPELHPSTLEGQILKDADFLAGMGAIGLIRIAIWTAEGEDPNSFPEKLWERLTERLPLRAAKLEFPESRQKAAELNDVLAIALSQLETYYFERG